MKRMAILLTLLFVAPLFGQTATGRFTPGERYVEPERNAPAATSRMFVRVSDGQGVDLPATGDGGGMIVVVNDPRGAAAAMLRTPSGNTSSQSVQRFSVDSKGQDVLHVDRTMAGRYRVTGIGSGVTVIASEPDSRLTMTTTVGPLSRTAGQPVTFSATLRDGETPVSGARVVARLTAPGGVAGDAIVLADRGNGEYSATVNDLPSATSGFWTARYDADGVTSQGVEFARTGSNDFMNERASARLGTVRAKVTGDTLHVTASADVLTPGRYRFDVIVATTRDAAGERHGIAWGEAERTLDAGNAQLTIDIPGVSNDDVFLDVRLLSLDAMGVAGRVVVLPAVEKQASTIE